MLFAFPGALIVAITGIARDTNKTTAIAAAAIAGVMVIAAVILMGVLTCR